MPEKASLLMGCQTVNCLPICPGKESFQKIISLFMHQCDSMESSQYMSWCKSNETCLKLSFNLEL